jgi:guanylate kinase
LQHYSNFQYVIINDDLDQAAEQLASIVCAERARLSRQEPRVKQLVNAFTAKALDESD